MLYTIYIYNKCIINYNINNIMTRGNNVQISITKDSTQIDINGVIVVVFEVCVSEDS